MYYNERIISLIKHIGERLGMDSDIVDNTPWHPPILQNSCNIKRGRYSALNWLPMYFHEFHFIKKDIQFSIFVQSDTGPWVLDINLDWNEEIDNFTDLNSSKTKIIFAITNSKKWDNKLIYEENYDKFLQDEFIIPFKNQTIICKAFELADFKDEKTTNNTLKEYVEYAKKKGIVNIEYVE
jgi:hypothetical protein